MHLSKTGSSVYYQSQSSEETQCNNQLEIKYMIGNLTENKKRRTELLKSTVKGKKSSGKQGQGMAQLRYGISIVDTGKMDGYET